MKSIVFFVFLFPLSSFARGTGKTSVVDGLLMLIIFGFFAYSIVKDSPRKKFVTSSILLITFFLLLFHQIHVSLGALLIIAAPFIGFAAENKNNKSSKSFETTANTLAPTTDNSISSAATKKHFSELIKNSDLNSLFNKLISEEFEGKNYKSSLWNRCSTFSNSNNTIQRRLYKSIRRMEMSASIDFLRIKDFDNLIDLRGQIKKAVLDSDYSLNDREFLEVVNSTLSNSNFDKDTDAELTSGEKGMPLSEPKLEFTTYLVNGIPHTYVDGKLKKFDG